MSAFIVEKLKLDDEMLSLKAECSSVQENIRGLRALKISLEGVIKTHKDFLLGMQPFVTLLIHGDEIKDNKGKSLFRGFDLYGSIEKSMAFFEARREFYNEPEHCDYDALKRLTEQGEKLEGITRAFQEACDSVPSSLEFDREGDSEQVLKNIGVSLERNLTRLADLQEALGSLQDKSLHLVSKENNELSEKVSALKASSVGQAGQIAALEAQMMLMMSMLTSKTHAEEKRPTIEKPPQSIVKRVICSSPLFKAHCEAAGRTSTSPTQLEMR